MVGVATATGISVAVSAVPTAVLSIVVWANAGDPETIADIAKGKARQT